MRPSGYLNRPDYRIDLRLVGKRLQVRAGNLLIADSADALVLDEQDHAPVIYVPRADVALEALVPMPAHVTHCPYKGDARHWADAAAPNAPLAWSYDAPYPEVAPITGYVAFYAERVSIEPVGEEKAAA